MTMKICFGHSNPGGVDAAVRIKTPFAGPIILRNTLPPLASKELLGRRAAVPHGDERETVLSVAAFYRLAVHGVWLGIHDGAPSSVELSVKRRTSDPSGRITAISP